MYTVGHRLAIVWVYLRSSKTQSGERDFAIDRRDQVRDIKLERWRDAESARERETQHREAMLHLGAVPRLEILRALHPRTGGFALQETAQVPRGLGFDVGRCRRRVCGAKEKEHEVRRCNIVAAYCRVGAEAERVQYREIQRQPPIPAVAEKTHGLVGKCAERVRVEIRQ